MRTEACRITMLIIVALGLSACAMREKPSDDASAWPDSSSRQLVVVVTEDWEAPQGRLWRFERRGGAWREVGADFPVTVGRKGSAWGLGLHGAQSDGPQKREGDGKAPAGVFAIGDGFGYATNTRTGLRYQAMQDSDWCVDVPGSPLYNRIVDTGDVGKPAVQGSTEPMRRDIHLQGDQKYRLGFVIEHNAQGVDRGGSCIFAHLWKAPGAPTAGCTAMSDADMQGLLAWLDDAKRPRFVLLPRAEFTRLHGAWDLPSIDVPERLQ